MTFQTFKRFVLMSVFFMTTSVVIYAQQFTMQGLIGLLNFSNRHQKAYLIVLQR